MTFTQDTFWPMPPMKMTAGQYRRRAEKLYDCCWRKSMRERGIRDAMKLLRTTRISFDDLMVRVKAQKAIYERKGVSKDFRPLFATWINSEGWTNEDVLAECTPKKRLKVMFEAWHKTVRGRDEFCAMDYHAARYVWLHLRKLDREIPKDLHLEAGNEYQWSVQQYGSIYAGEASDDIMAAIERLK